MVSELSSWSQSWIQISFSSIIWLASSVIILETKHIIFLLHRTIVFFYSTIVQTWNSLIDSRWARILQIELPPSHIMFLHPSEHPNSLVVSELLNGRNYGTWKKSMEFALIAGTCTAPAANTPLFAQWNRCDKMVISWLVHNVEKTISDNILFSSSSRQIWIDLQQ